MLVEPFQFIGECRVCGGVWGELLCLGCALAGMLLKATRQCRKNIDAGPVYVNNAWAAPSAPPKAPAEAGSTLTAPTHYRAERPGNVEGWCGATSGVFSDSHEKVTCETCMEAPRNGGGCEGDRCSGCSTCEPEYDARVE